MILTAYIDESFAQQPEVLTLMAGFVGYSGQWRKFERKFKRLLIQYGLTHFHAIDFRHKKTSFLVGRLKEKTNSQKN